MAAPKAIQTIRIQSTLIETANTNWDGSGTAPDIFVGAASPGSAVWWLDIVAVTSTSPGWVKLIIDDNVTPRFLTAIKVPATSAPDANNKPWEYHGWPLGVPVELPTASYSLQAATQTGDDFVITVRGGNYA